MSEIDELWQAVCRGVPSAFGDWMGRVERPIRRSLEPFARAVDAEGVVQEALERMWLFARDRGSGLAGENASLRFAIVMARNIARNEARKRGRERYLPPEDLPEVPVAPEPAPDPFLRAAILDCLGRLSGRPLAALRARLEAGHHSPDKVLATSVGMTLNTFLQNLVRARRRLLECLGSRGIRIEEALR